MAKRDTAPTESKSSGLIIALIVLTVLSLAVAGYMFYNQYSLNAQVSKQNQQIDSLTKTSDGFVTQIGELVAQETYLNQAVKELQVQKDRLIFERDSVQRLLSYSQSNNRKSQAEIARLRKRLSELQTQLQDIQQKYDDLLANSQATGTSNQAEIEALTAQRNQLSEENQRLRQQLAEASEAAENPIFATTISAVPGEVNRKGQFSPSKRSQNMDRVEVAFTLSRPPKPTENLIFKVFDNVNNEIPIDPIYRNELNAPLDPANQKSRLVFEGGKLDRRAEGEYTVRLYLTDVNKGVENQEIGLARFEVK